MNTIKMASFCGCSGLGAGDKDGINKLIAAAVDLRSVVSLQSNSLVSRVVIMKRIGAVFERHGRVT